MHHGNDGLSVKAYKEDVLKRLRTNRATHAKIVVEARKGYVSLARKALELRLKQIEKGRIVELQFNLRAPLDYTSEYDTAIEALTWHTGDEITLTAQQVRNLIMDKWDWADMFLTTNAFYSQTASAMNREKNHAE